VDLWCFYSTIVQFPLQLSSTEIVFTNYPQLRLLYIESTQPPLDVQLQSHLGAFDWQFRAQCNCLPFLDRKH
jgi:hypothetical protein